MLFSTLGVLSAAAPPPDSPGVYVRFFNNTTRAGEPAAAEVAPAIDFDFGDAPPRPGVNADGFSVRFSGMIRAPVAGLYTFVTESDDGAALWIGNIDVINDPGPHAAAHRETNRTFEWAAGSERAFTLDTFDAAGDAVARLKWVRPGGPGEPAEVFETIPASAFVSAARRAQNSPPFGLTLKSDGSDRVFVDFDRFAAADRYEIEVFDPDGSTARTAAAGIEGGPVMVDGLSPSILYTARVRAVSIEAGPTPWTTIHHVYSASEFPPIYQPWYLGPRDNGYIPAGSTHLRFRDNAFNETGYVLLRRNAGEPQSIELARFPAAEGMGSTIEYIDTQTVPNRSYGYEFYATGEAGRRSSAESVSLRPVVSGAGLRATLFESADFTDDPAVDGDPYELSGAALDEDWGDGGPTTLRSTEDFSVLLRGSFRARSSDHTFYTASAGGIALKITDYETGQTVLDFNRLDVERDMPLFGFQDIAGRVTLRAGHLYGIEVRYVERSGTAGYRVGWDWWGNFERSRATLPLPLLFESPPPPGSPLPAFAALSATTIGRERVIIHFQDTFATETAFELLRSTDPDGPFRPTDDRVPPGSTEISSYLPIWRDRYYYKVRVLQPEATIPFVDSEAIEVVKPTIETEVRRDRFESAAGFNLSGSAQVVDGKLRLTDAGAPASGAARSGNLVYLHRDGLNVEFDFQTTAAAGPTALSFFVRRQHAHPDDPHALEVRLAAAPGESNLNSAALLLRGIAQGPPRPVPASTPDLDFDRVTPGGTLPPRVSRVRLEYLGDDDTLELTVSDAANPAERFHASFPVDFAQVFGDTSTAYIGLAAAAGDGGARQEVLNFNYYWVRPGIVAVYVRGSAWLGQDNNPATTTFMEYLEAKGLGDDVMGYRVMGRGRTPPVSNPDDIVPWINVDQIVIRYGSVPFGSMPTPGMFTVSGRNPAASSYTVTSVSQVPGDPMAFMLTLNKPLGGGAPVTGAAPSFAENGDRVTLTVPGGSSGGSTFSFRMNVLQGDVDHANETVHNVLARDFAEVKKKFFKSTNSAVAGNDTDYSAFHDLDANGQILARDFAEVKKRFFHSLPPPPPAAAPLERSTSPTTDLFGDERVIS